MRRETIERVRPPAAKNERLLCARVPLEAHASLRMLGPPWHSPQSPTHARVYTTVPLLQSVELQAFDIAQPVQFLADPDER